MLITMFANAGTSGVYAVNIVTIVKAFYDRSLNPTASYLRVQTTQVDLDFILFFRQLSNCGLCS